MRPTQEEIRDAKKRATQQLSLIKEWIDEDMQDSDPEVLINDIKYLLEEF